MKTSNSPVSLDSYQNAKVLFSDEVSTADGYWADKGGKIIIVASRDNDPRIKMHSVYFNTHGHRFLIDKKRLLPNARRNGIVFCISTLLSLILEQIKTWYSNDMQFS